MPIGTDRLETWASYKGGAIKSAKDTHERIRANIEDSGSILNDREIKFDTKLQGSYANDTIVRASSDVDILVRLRDPFWSNKTELTTAEEEQFYAPGQYRKRSDYGYSDFREDVYDVLVSAYGSDAVTDGDKAIQVETPSLPLSADVVPAMEYRHYKVFSPSERYIEGIVFWSNSGQRIVNYPDYHIRNATQKQKNTNNRFKPTARMFKRARGAMVNKGIIDTKGLAPSYCVECLVWNVDDNVIDQNNLQDRYCDVVTHLNSANLQNFRHEHDLLDLFGSANTDWNTADATTFISGLSQLWDTL